ncbi:MAG: hypothetical protein M3270_08840 [Thermoproteota archaeon]|nr:hypothetical protein [Thermoproteota archaeon]
MALTILSMSAVSLTVITTTAQDYVIVQASVSQNTTTVDNANSTNNGCMNTTDPLTTADVRGLIEQAGTALQNNDVQGALTNLNSALDALVTMGDGEQNNNMTITPNEITDGTITTTTTTADAGTIGSGGAGGAGTAGGIMTGDGGST